MGDFPFSALGNVFGSVLGFIGANNARGQQAQQFEQSRILSQQQLDFQQAAAKNGIQWRVADAKAAGISPLVALGAPTFNPQAQGISAGGVPSDPTDYAGALGRAGQDISSAIGRTATAEQKAALAISTQRLANETKIADANVNMLNSQAAVNNARLMSTPPMASPVPGGGYMIPGQTQSGLGGSKNVPPEIVNANPNARHTQAGPPQPYIEWQNTPSGFSSQPPKASSKAEDEMGAPLMMEWLYKNRVGPMFGGTSGKPPLEVVRQRFPGATGTYWDYLNFEWRPTYHPSGKGAVGRYMDWRNSQ